VTWVALPGAKALASIALQVIGAYKPPLHDKAVVLKEGRSILREEIFFFK
jgi:hypothetical protein